MKFSLMFVFICNVLEEVPKFVIKYKLRCFVGLTIYEVIAIVSIFMEVFYMFIVVKDIHIFYFLFFYFFQL